MVQNSVSNISTNIKKSSQFAGKISIVVIGLLLLTILASNELRYSSDLLETSNNDIHAKERAPIVGGQWLSSLELGSFYDGGAAYDVFVSNNTAFVASFNKGLEIIDVSDPTSPAKLGQINGGGSSDGIYVLGNIAYLADGHDGLKIIDVSDPTNPTQLGSFYDGGYAYDVYVSGNVAYVADSKDGLEIIDVSNPSNPEELGQFDDDGNVLGIFVKGITAYLADEDDGLEIIDVSNPSNPVELGQFGDGGHPNEVYVSGNIAYVSNLIEGLEIINISDSSNPVEIGQFASGGGSHSVYVSDEIAYFADDFHGLEIINVSNPSIPMKLGQSSDAGVSKGVFVSEGIVYLATEDNGLVIIDAGWDDDNDGLTTLQEKFIYSTDPNKTDSDGDNLTDFEEIARNSNPSNPDTDGDSIPDDIDLSPTSKFIPIGLIIVIPCLIAGAFVFLLKIKKRNKVEAETRQEILGIGKKEKGQFWGFVSYALSDLKRFQIPRIVEKLRAYPEIDQLVYFDDNVGDDILKYMNRLLKDSDFIIVFCSPDSNRSSAVEMEWTAGLKLNKILIPIFQDVDDLPALLTTKMGVQYNPDGNIDAYIESIYKLIKKARTLLG